MSDITSPLGHEPERSFDPTPYGYAPDEQPTGLRPLPTPLPSPAADEPESRPNDHNEQKRRPRRAKLTPTSVKRVLSIRRRVEAASADARALVAAVLGAEDGTDELTVAVLTAGKNALAPLTELSDIVGAAADTDSPFAAVVAAGTVERDVLRKVWKVLQVLEAAEGGLPSAEIAAAAKVATAAASLDDAQRTRLSAVNELLA